MRFKILLYNDARAIHRGTARGIGSSDKWTVYMLATQLAFSQFPYGILPAIVGWVVGNAWVEELVPAGIVRWRVPLMKMFRTKQAGEVNTKA